MTYRKLKPCPECGHVAALFSYEGWNGSISSWRVECENCNHIGSCEGRKIDAIRVHNAHAEMVALAQQIVDAADHAGLNGPLAQSARALLTKLDGAA